MTKKRRFASELAELSREATKMGLRVEHQLDRHEIVRALCEASHAAAAQDPTPDQEPRRTVAWMTGSGNRQLHLDPHRTNSRVRFAARMVAQGERPIGEAVTSRVRCAREERRGSAVCGRSCGTAESRLCGHGLVRSAWRRPAVVLWTFRWPPDPSARRRRPAREDPGTRTPNGAQGERGRRSAARVST